MILVSCYSSHCVILSPWVWAGPSDQSLMNRIRQKWWVFTSAIRLQKDCGFHCGFSFLVCLPGGNQCHVMSQPSGEVQMVRDEWAWKQILQLQANLEMTAVQWLTIWQQHHDRLRAKPHWIPNSKNLWDVNVYVISC